MSKIIRVSKSKYRAVISEMLPYERPVFFSNRFFARFLKYYGIESRDGVLVATRMQNTPGLNEFLKILGGNKNQSRPSFEYSITKEGHSRGRILTIIHPYHQVQMLEFYDKYKTLVIDFCQRSNFSLRFPYKIATYQKSQNGYGELMSDDMTNEDTSDAQKHFFAYRKYNNINRFYNDYRFLRAEKRFCKMMKLDLKHCFEQIVPESLSLALFNRQMDQCDGTFAYDFYCLQRDFNCGKSDLTFEDNDCKEQPRGIVIGPEFSRIYAEIILQRIDKNVEQDLRHEGFEGNVDYLFYRYVDDGFFFYNSDSTRVAFERIYKHRLREYNQQINDKKTIFFQARPFLENISIAKLRLTKIIDEHFQNRLKTFNGFINLQKQYVETPLDIDYKHFINAVRMEIYFNRDVVNFKDITSFLLGLIQRRLLSLLRDFNCLYRDYSQAEFEREISEQGAKIKARYEREFIDFCLELVEVLFYLLECDMRMSTSIKIISIE